MQKKLIPIIERLFSLLVVFLLLSATTLWSGRFWGHNWLNAATEETASQSAATVSPNEREIAQLGLIGKTLSPIDSISWNVIGENGDTEGVVISSASLGENVIGYGGPTPLFIYIDSESKVQHVAAAANDETPSFFFRAARGILGQWDGLAVEEALEKDVDGVTGATYTSQSLIGNVHLSLSAYAKTDLMKHKEPAIGWMRTIIILSVYAMGMLVSWRFRRIKWLRTLILLLNVGVTGFWCGQFLSLSILHGWIENGVDVVLYLPTVVMLLIAIVMPYFGNPNHYCNWMCPYGSLQELAWSLPLPKLKVGAKVYKWMRNIRMCVLMLLLFMMWMGFGFSFMDYEPFSAFVISSATPAVMILAAIFVVAGIFIPHPWCQCICPVGTLLNLAEEKK